MNNLFQSDKKATNNFLSAGTVYIRQILIYKDGPRAEFFFLIIIVVGP